jgi:hypothetical protein
LWLWRGSGVEPCGYVFVEGRAKRFGKIGDDFAIRAWEIVDDAPRVEFAADGFLKSDFAVSAEDDLSEEADHAGLLAGEAALDEGENRFGKEAVNVCGRVEGARSLGEFRSDGGLR